MNLFENLKKLEYLDYLIRHKASGSPNNLAEKLKMSKRNVYRFINELKDLGLPIQYCKKKQSYYYQREVKLNFELFVDDEETFKIKGGKINLNFFERVPFFGTQTI